MLTVAAQSFLGSQGGIARVCELTARVAVEEGHPLSLLSVENEGGPFEKSGLWTGFGGSRARFVAACIRRELGGARMFYDQLGTARAHLLPAKLASRCGVWIHGIEVWDQLRPDRLRAARRAGFLLANTNYTRQHAAEYDSLFESASVCWLGTGDDELPAAGRAGLDGPPRVLIVGRIDNAAYKGHRELIEAWPDVVGAVPGARLTVVGTGPTFEKHKRLAAASSAAGFIDLVGFVPDQALPAYWSSSVVFAMPSRGEGFGLAYIEAMRWGVPTIASLHDAGQEINVHGETGLNVDLGRPGDLTDALIELLRNRDLAARMGAAGQQRWRQHFCYSAFRTRFSRQLTRFLECT
jgi:phosphatidylinositol alpha-1,6-mannosyltransferase